MRASTILSEVWRNIHTGTSRALLLMLLIAVASTGLATADMIAIVTLEQKAEQFRDSGATIRTLTAEAYVDAGSCEALASANTVEASGALAADTAIMVTALPGGSIPTYSVSPSFASVLGLDSTLTSGVWVPALFADTLHVTVGAILQTTSGELRIAGIYDWPDDGRDSRLNYAFLVPDASRTVFDECWAQIWPTSAETEDLLRFAGSIGSSDDVPLALSQVNKNHGTSFDGSVEYLTRITQYALPVAALTGLLIAFTSIRLRRLEYAGALHAGQRKTATLATALLEALVWVGVASLVAASALLLIAQSLSPGSALTIATTALRIVTAAAAGAFGGTAIAVLLVRENHLFRYFKDR